MSDPASPFVRLARIAAEVMGAPMALVTVIDGERQRYRAIHGGDFADCSAEDSFCAALSDRGPSATLVVPDAALDPAFASKPAVRDGVVRFYAGAAVTRTDGGFDGAVCVIDAEPRPVPSPAQLCVLQELAALAAEHIEAETIRRLQREQITKLRMAEALSGVGHWLVDLASGRSEWSDEVYRIHGVERAAFDPNIANGVAFYHPDDQPEVLAFMDHVVASGRAGSFKLRLIRADGEQRIVVCRADIDRDERGEAVALYGVFQDVTDQEDTLARLAASEARYRLIAENTTDVIAEIDLDGRNTFVSEASKTVLGRDPASLIGRSTLSITHPDDRPALLAAFQTLAASRRPRLEAPLRYRASTADGRWRWMEANPTLVFDDAGQPQRFVDVVRDVTRQKSIEAALEAALAQAEAAGTAKAEFLANMSHELRTPLTAIIGFAGLLQQFGTLSDQDRRFVTRISASADILLAMVGDVLDYSKLEAGAVELHEEEVEVGPLIQDTLSMVGAAAAEKWLTLRVDAQALASTTLTADRTRLRQVLMNLLSNAVKFTAAGSVSVMVEAAAGDRVRFSVADTGMGIPADRQHRLFQRFSQADGSTVRDYGGTGLGLAICKALVEAMGGEIGVHSIAGEGSTFWFSLPRHGAMAEHSVAA